MTKRCIFLGFFVLLYCSSVESDLFYDIVNKVDTCESYCTKTYPKVSLVNIKYESCCEQGCRFFTLVDLVEDNTDLNATKDACQASCMEAYSHTKDRYACNLGCESMAKHKQAESMMAQISFSVYVEDGNSVLMFQPAGEFEPDDVLTDPGLRQQLQFNWGLGSRGVTPNKLPETHVKTLPIKNDEGLGSGEKSGLMFARGFGTDWLDCAARKSGLPRLVLAGAIMLAVLVALWLCLAPERHTTKLEYLQSLDIPKDPFDYPPKYSLHVDKV